MGSVIARMCIHVLEIFPGRKFSLFSLFVKNVCFFHCLLVITVC